MYKHLKNQSPTSQYHTQPVPLHQYQKSFNFLPTQEPKNYINTTPQDKTYEQTREKIGAVDSQVTPASLYKPLAKLGGYITLQKEVICIFPIQFEYDKPVTLHKKPTMHKDKLKPK